MEVVERKRKEGKVIKKEVLKFDYVLLLWLWREERRKQKVKVTVREYEKEEGETKKRWKRQRADEKKLLLDFSWFLSFSLTVRTKDKKGNYEFPSFLSFPLIVGTKLRSTDTNTGYRYVDTSFLKN